LTYQDLCEPSEDSIVINMYFLLYFLTDIFWDDNALASLFCLCAFGVNSVVTDTIILM